MSENTATTISAVLGAFGVMLITVATITTLSRHFSLLMAIACFLTAGAMWLLKKGGKK